MGTMSFWEIKWLAQVYTVAETESESGRSASQALHIDKEIPI